MNSNSFGPIFKEIKEQTEANPNLEARATSVQHRIIRLYRDASAANDWSAVKGITEEWARQEVQLGQAIAAPVQQEQTGRAGA